MSSSGKTQSIVKSAAEIEKAWNYAIEGARGDTQKIIIEEFIDFKIEITLLTIKQWHAATIFCPAITLILVRLGYGPCGFNPGRAKLFTP